MPIIQLPQKWLHWIAKVSYSPHRECENRAEGVVANTLKLYSNGAVSNCLGFKHNLDPF